MNHDSAKVGHGHVAEHQHGADEGAGDYDVYGADAVGEHVGEGPSEDAARVKDGDEVEGHGAVGDAGRFAEEGDVEELDVEAYEADEGAEDLFVVSGWVEFGLCFCGELTKVMNGKSRKAVESMRERALGGCTRVFITALGMRSVARAMNPSTRTDQPKPIRGRRR